MAYRGFSELSTKTKSPRPDNILSPPRGVDQSMKPVLFEIFGELWTVQSRLGQGVSASVYRVSSGRAATAAVKEFQANTHGGDYGYHKERSVLEHIHGHKNIGKNATTFHHLTRPFPLLMSLWKLLLSWHNYCMSWQLCEFPYTLGVLSFRSQQKFEELK